MKIEKINKKNNINILIIGFFIISLIGTILHFSYEFSNNYLYVGLFSAVNESVWEHLKLGVFGILFFMIYEHKIIGDKDNYLIARFFSMITYMITVLLIYYTYTFIFKTNILIIDISIFYIAVLLSQIVLYKILNKKALSNNIKVHSKYLIISLVVIFILFTFYPPKTNLFIDKNSLNYGIGASYENKF